ncbi:MAG: GTP-binding protein [Saprospiraceae bacterium]|nr:GTP-binding protein [Saprospiraceae bacterium]MBP7643101.1 GTP-binding protein [Saprospiraceae bacterium]
MIADIDYSLDSELLRFSTAGSVDDGKSTLIGRLLYDSKSIFQDQYDAIEESSKKRGESGVNLALLTDGLKAEREQGITIDVAYRYFSTPKRKFIIADTPGHIQYTRNMVTGSSTSNVSLILVDARNGVIEQTKRHSIISSLLQIPHLVVCINKMDLVNYDEAVYNQVKQDYLDFAATLHVKDITFIPISALKGDNIVTPSENMPWYTATTLMDYLENVKITNDRNFEDARFPVQYVIRPNTDEFHDFRGYAGRVAGGVLKVGDDVTVLPSGHTSKIAKINLYKDAIQEAYPPMSVAIELEDDVDISRGDMLVKTGLEPQSVQDLELMICWFDQSSPLNQQTKYAIRHTTREARCVVKDIIYKLNVNDLSQDTESKLIKMNDIACIKIKTTTPLVIDQYSRNRITGSVILIDEGTNNTVAAGMIV